MPKKLLLADDSITIQKVVGITLANEDLEITSVDNGEDAIARARQIRPDLVLADASMPKKDGYQVAEALKNDPATASIPVLILAGQLEGHPDQARLAACRADGFIPKPFQSQELIDRVRRILGLAGPVAVAVGGKAPGIRQAPPAPTAPPRVSDPMAQTMRTGQPVAAQRPLAASPAAPRVAAPTPVPSAPVPRSMDEADFGDLSSGPAASGDQDLWGGEGVAAAASNPAHPSATDALWTSQESGNGKSAPPESMVHDLVTNAAELANLEKFGGAPEVGDPSGLDLDEPAAFSKPHRAGDDNLVHPNDAMEQDARLGGKPMPMSADGGAAVAAMLQAMPPERLEQIVREVARSILQPILEKIAWEVVPDLAEDLIKDEIKRLTQPQ